MVMFDKVPKNTNQTKINKTKINEYEINEI